MDLPETFKLIAPGVIGLRRCSRASSSMETERRGEKENHRSHEAALGIETGRIGAGAKGLGKEGRHREDRCKKSSGIGSERTKQWVE